MKHLIRDDRGAVPIVQLVTIIIAPIVALMLASAMISAIRTGSGVTEALTRSAEAQILFSDFQSTVAAATTATVTGPNAVTLRTDPTRLPPGISSDARALGTTCTTTTWTLKDAGALRTLTRTTQGHTSDCSSAVRRTSTEEFTGLSQNTAFAFENAAGRTLTLTGSTLTPAAGTAPAGVSAAAWASTSLGAVILEGTVQEMFADRPTTVTAVTTPSIAP